MGAVVAAVAAAHMKRITEILDAYRVAGATTPGHTRVPAELGLDDHARQIDELSDAQVLRAGNAPGSYYLDESGYVRYRDQNHNKRSIAILTILILAAILLVSVLFLKRP